MLIHYSAPLLRTPAVPLAQEEDPLLAQEQATWEEMNLRGGCDRLPWMNETNLRDITTYKNPLRTHILSSCSSLALCVVVRSRAWLRNQ